MAAERLAVVAGEDDDRVVGQPALLQVAHDAAELGVDVGRARVVVAEHVRPVLPAQAAGVGVELDLVRGVRAGGVPFVVRPGRDVDVLVELQVVDGRLVGGVRAGLAVPDEPRPLVLGEGVDQVECLPGQPVGHRGLRRSVQPHAALGAGVNAHALGVEALALQVFLVAGELRPLEAPVGRACRLGLQAEAVLPARAEVPLTVVAAAVPGLPQPAGEQVRAVRYLAHRAGQVVRVAQHAVVVDVEARHDRRPRRRADRARGVGRLEAHALGRQPVDVRRAARRRPVATERGEAVLVGEEEEDVGTGCRHSRRRCSLFVVRCS